MSPAAPPELNRSLAETIQEKLAMSFLGLNSPSNQFQYDSEEQKSTNTIGAIMFFILLGGGLIVGGIVFYIMHSANRTHEWLERSGTKVSAECVAMNFYRERHCAEYKFTVGKITYHGSGSIKYPKPSNNEDLFYDPANPDIHRLANDEPPYDLRMMYFGLIATLVIGLLAKFFVEPLVSMIRGRNT
ncbi:MAG TPA: DUF3592 domain-containing protein [Pyrinomonadaceae bacterium]|nr:DUF3592 domain-containing protein [Pyrinomonadaceae bacterium]